MNSSTKKESFSLLKSFIALLLIVGCLWAAQWQYHRGVARHARNTVIETNSTMKTVSLTSVLAAPQAHEWQSVTTEGSFDATSQILLRNRYSEGVYGFELLTRFTNTTGQTFWVDCGWVKAGEYATTQPELPTLPTGQVKIVGRLRLDSSLPQGSFFAIPSNKSDGLVSKANAQSGSTTETFYIDLLRGSDSALTPEVPAQLPELSDGPHMAYALQWLFFGGLVVYGRFLIRRDVLSSKEL
ncbi:SURF1 family protein [Actinobacteria bacterium IMCC25003]|nr:SURF1 family protein [Actinobacteria bacterium IMCC25003]